MELVALVGKDEENWGQINAVIKKGTWDKVLIVKTAMTSNFPEGTETVEVDANLPLAALKQELLVSLKEHLSGDFEVALSIASGTGKEHMALISALLSIPVGIRFAVYTKSGVEFIN